MHTSHHRTNRTTLVAWAGLIALACAHSAGCATGEDTGDDQPGATGGAAGQSGQAGAVSDASAGGASGASGKAGAAGNSGAGGEAGVAGSSGEGGSAGAEGGAAGDAGSGGSPGTGGSSTGGSPGTGGSSTGGSPGTGGGGGTVQMPAGCAIPGSIFECVPSTNQGCDTASDEACDYDYYTDSFTCYSAQDPWLNDASLGQPCDIEYGPTCKPTSYCSTDDPDSTAGICVKYCCSDSDCSGTKECLAWESGNGTLGGCYDASTGGTGGSGTGGSGGSSGGGGAGGKGGSGTGGSGTGGAGGGGGTAGSGGAIDDGGLDASGGSTGQGGSAGSDGGTPALYISEYIEGSSNNKALELYNAGSTAYDVGNCIVRRYQNGATPVEDGGDPNPPLTIPAGTMLAAGDVFVLCHTLAVQGILDVCDEKNANVNFNGNDALELVCEGVSLDVFGKPGENPGTEWGTDPTSTADQTLVRKCSITQGDTNGADAFDPSVEWDGYPGDTFTYLGSRNCP